MRTDPGAIATTAAFYVIFPLALGVKLP